MIRRRLLLLAGLLLALPARAWEEEQAIAFILAWHPVVSAQRRVAVSYQPPSLTRRVMEHTSFYVRAASGTSSTVSEGGDTTTASPMTVGIQVNIPLASPSRPALWSNPRPCSSPIWCSRPTATRRRWPTC
jgi:hypothetical protein